MGNLKVGDYVVIKSQEWYRENRNLFGYVRSGRWGDCIFTCLNAKYCGEVHRITRVCASEYPIVSNSYILDIPKTGTQLLWDDWMFEEFKHGDMLRINFKSGATQTIIFDNRPNNDWISYIVSIYNFNDLEQTVTYGKVFMGNVATIRHCSDEEKQHFLNELKKEKIFWNESNKLLEDLR